MRQYLAFFVFAFSLTGCATYQETTTREHYIVNTVPSNANGMIIIEKVQPVPEVIYGYPTYPYCNPYDVRCGYYPMPTPKPNFNPNNVPRTPGYYKTEPSRPAPLPQRNNQQNNSKDQKEGVFK